NAAHNKHGRHKYASGYVLTGPGNQPPKIIRATIISSRNRLVISGRSREVVLPGKLHASSNGYTISAPKPSPVHHVNQRDVNFAHCPGSPKHTLKLPI